MIETDEEITGCAAKRNVNVHQENENSMTVSLVHSNYFYSIKNIQLQEKN